MQKTFIRYILALIVLVFFSPLAHAQQSWKYTAFPLVKYDAHDKLPLELKVGKNTLFAAFPKGSPTFTHFGVEQFYSNEQLKKRVFVKKNVQLSTSTIIGGWYKVARGQVLHLRNGRNINAYYAEGLNTLELEQLRQQFQKSVKSASFMATFLPCAYAEVTSSPDKKDQPAAGVDEKPPEDTESLTWCITKKTGSALADTAVDAWEATKNTAATVYDDPWGAAKAVGTWVKDTGSSVGGYVKDAAIATKDYAGAVWNDPNKIYRDVSDAVDKTKKIATVLYQQLQQSFKEFNDLPTPVKNAIICEVAGDLAAQGLIGVVLSAAGGAGAVKLAATIARYATKLKAFTGVLEAMGRAKNMAGEKAREYIRRILRGKDDPKKLLAEIQQEPVLAGSPIFKAGQEINVPRSDGTINTGRVSEILPDGSVRVTFTDPATGLPAYKTLPPDKLAAFNKPPEFSPGNAIKIPRSDGTISEGQVAQVYPDGRVRVTFEQNGISYEKTLSPEDLRRVNAPGGAPSGPYTFRSVKGEDYVSRGGDRIAVDFNSENLRRTMSEAIVTYDKHGVTKIDPARTPTPAEMEQASKAWLEYAAKIESKQKESLDAYARPRDDLIRKGNGTADLGDVAVCEAAVCRELSIFGSVSLSEMGYTTRVVTGNVTGGGHAWIEFVDPKTNKVIGLLDSNYTKRYYSNPDEYYRTMNARPIRYTTVASPR